MNRKQFWGGLAGCILSSVVLIQGGTESVLRIKRDTQRMEIPQVQELVQLEGYLRPLYYTSHIGDIHYTPQKKEEVRDWITQQRPEMQHGYTALLHRYEQLVKAGALEIRNETNTAFLAMMGYSFLTVAGGLGTLYFASKMQRSLSDKTRPTQPPAGNNPMPEYSLGLAIPAKRAIARVLKEF